MAALNRIQLLGFVGQEPKVLTTKEGQPIAFASLATNEPFFKNNQREVITEWHNLVFFGRLANVTSLLKKGSYVFIEGRLRTQHWIDKAGVERYSTNIVVKTMQLLDRTKPTEIPETTLSVADEYLSYIKSMIEQNTTSY
ncbi:single-stranded DNA-binding protein [Legionella maceachernii]|uniref:Single-stranded DNA-binding protein n=1 Tax=Legionella maceachernii TaxID=466 RepID=A0A0W0VY33_9GAMM|nr:single-stranded DNA-binding protein [Legionella maceachernii]KTD25159.1 single strand DNA binding protein [Legionella maceachernii]SKA27210.1 single-strand binding protein [Legionella maceachernii]SUP04591.1 Helix-destabilizing protein [Legionella maceachernii]